MTVPPCEKNNVTSLTSFCDSRSQRLIFRHFFLLTLLDVKMAAMKDLCGFLHSEVRVKYFILANDH